MGEVAARRALWHSDVLGAGAKQRRIIRPMDKIHAVMSEFKRGTLHSGGGGKAQNRKQAIAIALSEARRHGQAVNPMPHHTIRTPFKELSHPAPVVSWSAKNGGKFGNEI